MNDFTLLHPKEYVHDLTHKVNAATTRVYLLALVITDDEFTAELIDALCEAADRGVEVVVGTDLFFTYRELGDKGRRKHYIRTQWKTMRAMKRRLENHGARMDWIGQHGLTLFSRRTHSKWCVVDDTVYSFGGVNLYSTGISNIDFMLRIHDKSMADSIVFEQHEIISENREGRAHRSYSEHFGPHQVLFDGGLMGDSIIYRRICQYARRAKSVTYVSQYSPSGTLNFILRGRSGTRLFFNKWENADSVNVWLLRLTAWLHTHKNSYRKKKYLHCKFMIFTMPSGEKIAITGSHNLVPGGVWLGTREIALETRDPKTIQLIEDFLATSVK